jgi:hypothetical protein
LGIKDARGVKWKDGTPHPYPLFWTLRLAGEEKKAQAYARGFGEVTGQRLEVWRDGEKY